MAVGASRVANPFNVTKAVDLNDDQIQALWVSVTGASQEFIEFTKPTSPVPTFIMGAKGSGKTHLMRYHAFELQTLRYRQRNEPIRTGVERDGYIGIYVRCGGLNSERFAGKRQSVEKWSSLFAYYIEVWLVQNLIDVMLKLQLSEEVNDEEQLCREIYSLFDRVPDDAACNINAISLLLSSIRKQLDYSINNCVMSGVLNVEILFTRGHLLFGIPKILARRYASLKNVMFVYALDEFENLTITQQKFVNTLVREKELPCTIRIGSRLYGVKTQETLSDNEENLQDSEFEKLPIDRLFRTHKERYQKFARALVEKRLVASYGLAGVDVSENNIGIDWSAHFQENNYAWNSDIYLKIVKDKPSAARRHMVTLREKLTLLGMKSESVELVFRLLSETRFPLIEKAAVLQFYQDLHRGIDPIKSADSISSDIKSIISDDNKSKNRVLGVLSHYKSDLIAQLNRENDVKQSYAGLDTFIRMSAGLPRGLLTILRSVFEWSNFRGEGPLQGGRISIESQIKGVKEAADWFYDNMRKAGDDGVAIQTAIDRLARLFQANRFADKPTECSLICFSCAEADIEADARHTLSLAESRSFLNRVAGGQREKNSERVTMKFQLSNMLSPRWDLPLGRRGTHTFSPTEIAWIFNPRYSREFEIFLGEWTEKRTAPFFGKKIHRASDGLKQPELF